MGKSKKKTRKKHIAKHKKKITETKKENPRVSTGIVNFDNLIEGGFEKSSTNLLVGGPGSGKTIFATQFLIGGIKKGEKCLYVTFEEKKKQFYDNMIEFGWNLEEYEKKGLFIFLEYSPEKVKTMLEEGGGEIESLIINKKITRMVIDSITSFTLLFENELDKREAALSLFNMTRNWNCTSLLNYEDESSEEGAYSSKAMEFESDSLINLYFQRGKNKRERYIEIIKMRGTNHSKNIYRFEIGRNGLIINKKPSSIPIKIK